MEAVVTIAEVEPVKTRSGTIRYAVRDTDGNEYTTFRESIGERAQQFQGQRVRIEYHEQQRGQYTNVYLDKVEPAPQEPAPAGTTATPRRPPGERPSTLRRGSWASRTRRRPSRPTSSTTS